MYMFTALAIVFGFCSVVAFVSSFIEYRNGHKQSGDVNAYYAFEYVNMTLAMIAGYWFLKVTIPYAEQLGTYLGS